MLEYLSTFSLYSIRWVYN